jgi:outer membrane immunogenic protein
MKKIMLTTLAALALATPAVAANPFTGVRAEATVGLDDVTGGRDTTAVSYGVGLGLDAEVWPRVVVGVAANLDNVFDRQQVAANARLGYVVTDRVMVYGTAGYANWYQLTNRDLHGFRAGAGVEARVAGPLYAKVEYRYSDFQSGVGQHGVVAGAGLRF